MQKLSKTVTVPFLLRESAACAAVAALAAADRQRDRHRQSHPISIQKDEVGMGMAPRLHDLS